MGTVPVWRDGRKRSIKIKPESTGTPDKDEAAAILTQIAARYQRGNIENRDAPPVFSDLINTYLDAGKSDRYLLPIVRALGDCEVPELTQAKIDAEGRKAYPRVAQPTMRRQWHGRIQAVLHHSNVRIELNLPEASKSTTRWCTPKQADTIIGECAGGRFRNPWAPAMAELFFATGCRVSEALGLDVCDLDLEYGTVTFRDPKNGFERTNLLPARTVTALKLLPNLTKPGRVFRTAAGKPYTISEDHAGASMIFLRSAAKRAGVAFNPHMSRHSFATWFYSQTKDALGLKAAGGWRTSSAMERYTHLVPMKVGQDAIALGWDFRERPTLPVAERA